MKTTATAAQLFEPATTQTTKGASASGVSAADFSKMVADFSFMVTPQDASKLVTAPTRQQPAVQRAEPSSAARADAPARPAAPQQQRDAAPARPSATKDTSATKDASASAQDSAAAQPVSDEQDAPAEDAVAAKTDTDADTTADTAATEPTPASDAEAVPMVMVAPPPAIVTEMPAQTKTGAASGDETAATADETAPTTAAADPATTGTAPATTTAPNANANADAKANAAAPAFAARANAARTGAAQQGQQQAAQSDALSVAAAANADGTATNPTDPASVLKAAAADAASGRQGTRTAQEADLAGLANGAGLTIRSGNPSPALPQSSLVGGAVMAQAMDGQAGFDNSAANGDNANQFLGNGEAATALANALGKVEQAAGTALGTKPFAAALEAVAPAGTSSAPGAAAGSPTTPIAGLGQAGAPTATGPTGIAQPAAAARGPQVALPVQQISGALNSAVAKGQDSISIQLTPENLGRVDIKLDFSGDTVSAMITADNQDTLDLLKQDSRQLEKMLSNAGLQTDQQSLSFSLRDQNQNSQQTAREERSSRSRAQLLAIDDAAPTAPATQSRARTTVGGIDISV